MKQSRIIQIKKISVCLKHAEVYFAKEAVGRFQSWDAEKSPDSNRCYTLFLSLWRHGCRVHCARSWLTTAGCWTCTLNWRGPWNIQLSFWCTVDNTKGQPRTMRDRTQKGCSPYIACPFSSEGLISRFSGSLSEKPHEAKWFWILMNPVIFSLMFVLLLFLPFTVRMCSSCFTCWKYNVQIHANGSCR